MEKYTLTIKQVVTTSIEVDAYNTEDAEEKARERVLEALNMPEEDGIYFDVFVEEQTVEHINNNQEY